MKELVKQLKSLRHENINPDQEWLKKNRNLLLAQIKNTAVINKSVGSKSFSTYKLWSGLSVFLPHNFVFKVVRPVMAMFLILGLGMGSWIATVGAAQQSMPGDLLYTVVRVDEMTRAGLAAVVGATGTETKMRVGFAKRRAEESKKLVSTNNPDKIKQVTGVVRDLKKEIEKVNNNLQEVEKQDKENNHDNKVKAEVVSSINKETKEIKNILVGVKADLNVSSSTNSRTVVSEVELANSAVKETAVKAVEVLVSKHLQGDDTVSKQEVKQAIKSQIESNAKETVINKNVLENVKEEVKAVFITASTSASTSIDRVGVTTTNAQGSLDKNQLNKAGVEEVTKKTAEAVVEVQQASTEVNQKVSQAEKLLSEDNLNQAIKVVREVSDVAKKADQTTKETIESLQVTVPTVMASAAIKGAADTAITTSTSLELKNIGTNSTTSQAGIVTGTIKQTETTTVKLNESR